MVSTRRGAAPAANTRTTAKTRRKATPAPSPAPVPQLPQSNMKRRLRSTKAANGSPLQVLATPPKRKKSKASPPLPPPPEPVEEEEDPGRGIFFQTSETPFLSAGPSSPQPPLPPTPPPLPSEQELDKLRKALDVKQGRARRAAYRAAQREEKEAFLRANPPPVPPKPRIITRGNLKGTEEAFAVFDQIFPPKKPTCDPVVTPAVVEPPKPSSPASPAVNALTTSVQATPAKVQDGVWGRLWNSVKSPFTSKPAAAPEHQAPENPTTPVPGPSDMPTNATPTPTPIPGPTDLTTILTPIPTPVGESRQDTRTKPKMRLSRRQAMVKAVKESVADPDHKAKAEAWAKAALATLPGDSALLGEKRKRLDQGAVKVGDLKYIPACKPWESSFGIDPDIDMLDDEDDAPAWAVLQEMLRDDLADQPPPKKHMAARKDTTDEVPSLNDMFGSDASKPDNASKPDDADKPGSPKLFNSHGNSVSLLDLHPRPAWMPSPIFEQAGTHQEGANVFNESEQLKEPPSEQESPPNYPNKEYLEFRVPDDSDTDSDEEETTEPTEATKEQDSSLWTQQPPPAPVPAHASLPTPLTASPSIPQVPANLLGATPAVDQLERQRLKITKHTPAKPSRLREMFVPSPSLKSDTGSLAGSPIPAIVNAPELAFDDMPEAVDLDLPDDVMAEAKARMAANSSKLNPASQQWDDPILVYSSEDEMESE